VTGLSFQSESETIRAELYGTLPAERAVILCHGQSWDASGWRDVAPHFAERGVPALAVNLRGYDGSTGTTDGFESSGPWSAVTDLRAAKGLLRERGAREIALVGASLGGHVVLASSYERDVECVVSISAPVTAVPDELSRRVSGRKLYVCADGDPVWPNVSASFAALSRPKELLAFGGDEHSRGMFTADYAAAALGAIVEFVCRRA
jgi:pimeloyl-ACP methyl ester carboxylesterase